MTTFPWTKWEDAFPDWRDVGRRVEIEGPEACAIGTLEADEFFTGEDEIPVFSVKTDDSRSVSFSSCDRWRFLS